MIIDFLPPGAETESKCQEDEHLVSDKLDLTDTWQLAGANPQTSSALRFYRIESGLWHGYQYLNFLKDLMQVRDTNFSLELATLGKLRSRSVNARRSKFKEFDIMEKLDYSISHADLLAVWNRLCFGVFSFILKVDMKKYRDVVHANHDNVLSGLSNLTRILQKKEMSHDFLTNQGMKTQVGKFNVFSSGHSDSESCFYMMSNSTIRQAGAAGGAIRSPVKSRSIEKQESQKSEKYGNVVHEFLKSDRAYMVDLPNLNAGDDEHIARALPWSAISIEHEYMTEAELESLGFETISTMDAGWSGSYVSSHSVNPARSRDLRSISGGLGAGLESAKHLMSKFGVWK